MQPLSPPPYPGPSPVGVGAAAMPAAPAGAPDPRAGVLACLPLQIGTTSAWSAGRAAAALFPGLALIGAGVGVTARFGQGGIVLLAAGGLLVVYAIGHMRAAVRTRASDILLLPDGILVDGGRLHSQKIPWSELSPPYAELEDTKARRITLWSIVRVSLALATQSFRLFGGVTSEVQVWRLHVHRQGQRVLIAETDRPIERDSMSAAASSVSAVVSGQRYVAEAPTVAAKILTCQSCGAPAVPDDAPFVTCAFCNMRVVLPDDIRGQAAAAKTMSESRGTTAGIIARLRDQPRAAHTNRWLAILAGVMFAAWPIGWGLIAARVLSDGFQAADALCLLLPFSAVLAGFFLARARLADRGALQLLTLGFGALSPRREGEPSRCRRCQGPLPSAGLGGVAQCRYCAAENIVGLDLRPSVDPARTEQASFDVALQKRAAEKRLWTTLSVVAGFALLVWMGGTALYIVHMEDDGRPAAHDGSKPHPTSTAPWQPTPPRGNPPPPHPGGTKRPK